MSDYEKRKDAFKEMTQRLKKSGMKESEVRKTMREVIKKSEK